MQKYSYQLSDKGESFLNEQKSFLGVENIKFGSIDKFPNQSLFNEENAYGTCLTTNDKKTVVIFLNPKMISLHPKEERNYIAEVITVHEILHVWLQKRGFARAESEKYPEIGVKFSELFHHRAIERELSRLGYSEASPNTMIGEKYVREVAETTRQEKEETMSIRFGDWAFSWNLLQLAEVNYRSNQHFQKAYDLLEQLNHQLVTTCRGCINIIDGFEVWRSPSVMYYAMREVRNLVEPRTNQTISLCNPTTTNTFL